MQKYTPQYLKFLIATFFLLTLWACSTQKNTFISRNFHSTTTKYNGYFNARESYRGALRQLDNQHEDNYEDVLSIFRYGSAQQQISVAGNMETAYQKSSTAIRRHSMNIKGIEYNRWIDDSYFLIARSHYFKGDHNLAILTFQYIIRQFETPLKYYSKIWIAKTYIKAEQYNNALDVLTNISEDINAGMLDSQALLLYNKVFADLYLQQRQFIPAIPFLEQSIALSSDKKEKTRFTYILAQVYHQEKQYAKAQESYQKVLKLRPDFQMAFQARINMAMAFDIESGNPDFILSQLNKMLRKNENREFRDQIYYALGQFYMRQNDVDKARENYQLSIDNYRDNQSQKGISFLRLAEIDFTRQHYIQASDLYDSTMTYLSEQYPEYENAGAKSMILRELAGNLRSIEKEDSLQQLASMNDSERNEILDQIIARIEEEKRLEQEREQERALMRQQMARAGRGQNQEGNEGGWYFYNPSAISFGRNEFYAKWGEREQGDLWRISNKRIVAFGPNGETIDDDSTAVKEGGGAITRASLMQNLPTTPEKMAESEKKIALAYYNIALIFKDKLINEEKTIEYFEILVNRFPDNENVLLSSYFLYTIHTNNRNSLKAETYRNLIINKYPDTDFARILTDPTYYEKIREKENRVKNVYNQAYQAYQAGDYVKVGTLSDEALSDSTSVTRELAAKFSFLRAMVYAKTDQSDQLLNQLTFVTENFPETSVHEPATQLLAYLGREGFSSLNNAANTVAQNDSNNENSINPLNETALSPESLIFNYKPDVVHFYVLVINNKEINIRDIRNDINLFNNELYKESGLNMSTLFFDQNRQLITITNFPSASLALDYGKKLTETLLTKNYNTDHFTPMPVSLENYPVFYQERKLNEYLEFYNYYYQRP